MSKKRTKQVCWDFIVDTRGTTPTPVEVVGQDSPKVLVVGDEAPTLEEAREFIGGNIELVHTRSGTQLIVDEEGALKDLPLNPFASQLYGGPIAGPAMVLKGKAKWT
jgi:hypothetical protein